MPKSAVIGQPPNTDDDFYIVRALLRLFHSNEDPAKGVSFGKPPAHLSHDSRRSLYLAGSIVFLILSIFITGSRLLIRGLFHQVKWGWDDWFIIPALICGICWYIGTILARIYGGAGKHIWSLTYQEYNLYLKTAKINIIFFVATSVLIKISITLFIRRLTGISSKIWRWINNVFLTILFAELVAFTFQNAFSCKPLAGGFDLITAGKSPVPMKCISRLKPGKVRVYFNIILDFFLLSTPIIILWKVRMPTEKKVRVCALFAIGIIPCVASIMTVVSGEHLAPDFTYKNYTLTTWIEVEMFFSFLIASAPILHTHLPRSWQIMSSAVRNQLSSHADKTRSQRIPDERSRGHETLESGKIYRQDDVELEYSAKPVSISDGESGKRGLLEDQHPWADHSVQVPDRTYQHSTNAAGTTSVAGTRNPTDSQTFYLGKESQ